MQLKKRLKHLFNIIPNVSEFNAIFSLNLKLWFKTGGIISSFFIPLILIFVLGNFFSANQIGYGLLSATSFITIMTSFGSSFSEVRTTSLLKRIGVTPIRKVTYMIVSIIFTSLLVIITLIWTGLWLFLANRFNWIDTAGTIPGIDGKIIWTEVFWPGVITSLFINFLVSMTLIIFVASVANSFLSYISILIIYFFAYLLAGGTFLVSEVTLDNPFLKWFTRIFIPGSYLNFMGYESFLNENVFDFTVNSIGSNAGVVQNRILNVSIPFVYIVGFFTATFFVLKWDNTR